MMMENTEEAKHLKSKDFEAFYLTVNDGYYNVRIRGFKIINHALEDLVTNFDHLLPDTDRYYKVTIFGISRNLAINNREVYSNDCTCRVCRQLSKQMSRIAAVWNKGKKK